MPHGSQFLNLSIKVLSGHGILAALCKGCGCRCNGVEQAKMVPKLGLAGHRCQVPLQSCSTCVAASVLRLPPDFALISLARIHPAMFYCAVPDLARAVRDGASGGGGFVSL